MRYALTRTYLAKNPYSSSKLSDIDGQKKTLITYHNLLRIK
jgi:hypothetical protein